MPIALGKYLLPFRTQKSSPVAPIILLCGKLGRCQIINKSTRKGGFFDKCVIGILLRQQMRCSFTLPQLRLAPLLLLPRIIPILTRLYLVLRCLNLSQKNPQPGMEQRLLIVVVFGWGFGRLLVVFVVALLFAIVPIWTCRYHFKEQMIEHYA